MLIGGGMAIALYGSNRFDVGAWYTGVTLVAFAVVGRAIVEGKPGAGPADSR